MDKGLADKWGMTPAREQALFLERFETLECWLRNCRPRFADVQPLKGRADLIHFHF